MRLSDKTIINKPLSYSKYLPSDFIPGEHEGAVLNKGISVIWEKAHLCPCKSKEGDLHHSTCRNCGGAGWIFVNPTRTKMIIQSIHLDNKLKEAAMRDWGMIDMGTVKITASYLDKITFMDRITIEDATAETSEIVYPTLTDDLNGQSESDSGLEGQLFAFVKYPIEAVDFVGLFDGDGLPLKKLEEPADYTFRDNVLLLGAQYDALVNPKVTIRYVYRPTYHITDLLRESMTSTINPVNQNHRKELLPILALGKRAHLIKDLENFAGDRLLDNSWLPDECQAEAFTKFQRQLRYTSAQEIYDILTPQQRVDLFNLYP